MIRGPSRRPALRDVGLAMECPAVRSHRGQIAAHKKFVGRFHVGSQEVCVDSSLDPASGLRRRSTPPNAVVLRRRGACVSDRHGGRAISGRRRSWHGVAIEQARGQPHQHRERPIGRNPLHRRRRDHIVRHGRPARCRQRRKKTSQQHHNR